MAVVKASEVIIRASGKLTRPIKLLTESRDYFAAMQIFVWAMIGWPPSKETREKKATHQISEIRLICRWL